MKIFKHPRNGVVIATTDTHAVYIPLATGMAEQTQLQDADYHLTNKTTRCFELCEDLGQSAVPKKPQTTFKPANAEPANTDKN